jgi:hypothetical protein
MDPQQDEDSELEAWLAGARLDPVPDDGFSAQVMQSLPVAPRRPDWARGGPALGAAIGVGLLALQTVGGGIPARPALLALMLGLAGMTALGALWAFVEREGG